MYPVWAWWRAVLSSYCTDWGWGGFVSWYDYIMSLHYHWIYSSVSMVSLWLFSMFLVLGSCLSMISFWVLPLFLAPSLFSAHRPLLFFSVLLVPGLLGAHGQFLDFSMFLETLMCPCSIPLFSLCSWFWSVFSSSSGPFVPAVFVSCRPSRPYSVFMCLGSPIRFFP